MQLALPSNMNEKLQKNFQNTACNFIEENLSETAVKDVNILSCKVTTQSYGSPRSVVALKVVGEVANRAPDTFSFAYVVRHGFNDNFLFFEEKLASKDDFFNAIKDSPNLVMESPSAAPSFSPSLSPSISIHPTNAPYTNAPSILLTPGSSTKRIEILLLLNGLSSKMLNETIDAFETVTTVYLNRKTTYASDAQVDVLNVEIMNQYLVRSDGRRFLLETTRQRYLQEKNSLVAQLKITGQVVPINGLPSLSFRELIVNGFVDNFNEFEEELRKSNPFFEGLSSAHSDKLILDSLPLAKFPENQPIYQEKKLSTGIIVALIIAVTFTIFAGIVLALKTFRHNDQETFFSRRCQQGKVPEEYISTVRDANGDKDSEKDLFNEVDNKNQLDYTISNNIEIDVERTPSINDESKYVIDSPTKDYCDFYDQDFLDDDTFKSQLTPICEESSQLSDNHSTFMTKSYLNESKAHNYFDNLPTNAKSNKVEATKSSTFWPDVLTRCTVGECSSISGNETDSWNDAFKQNKNINERYRNIYKVNQTKESKSSQDKNNNQSQGIQEIKKLCHTLLNTSTESDNYSSIYDNIPTSPPADKSKDDPNHMRPDVKSQASPNVEGVLSEANLQVATNKQLLHNMHASLGENVVSAIGKEAHITEHDKDNNELNEDKNTQSTQKSNPWRLSKYITSCTTGRESSVL